MPEMDALFQEMMRTLREARQAVLAETEMHARAHSPDTVLLARLQRSAAEFASQAASLLPMMVEHEADEAMIREAEELSDFFWATEDQIASVLEARLG